MTNLSSLSKSKLFILLGLGGLVLTLVLLQTGHPQMGVLGLGLSALCLALTFLNIRKTSAEIGRMTQICGRLSRGDFEARLVHIREKGNLKDFQETFNHLTDTLDAFVRESTAVMQCVSHNQYYRRILEDGMSGALVNGARVINRATASVGQKMAGFVNIANDLDRSLGDVVGQIGTAAGNLESTAKTMQETVQMTRTGAADAVRISADTSTNVHSISAAAEEMSSCIAEITQQMSRTAQLTQAAVERSATAKTQIDELSSIIDKIGDVAQIINGIAGQTNLLALNATIEAARAGEAGKGFAVVANEVKELAAQTGKATDEISTLITRIQNATRGTVDSFNTINQAISETETAAAMVAAAIEEQSAASREVASNAERTSLGTTSVANNVRDIDQSVGLVDQAAGQVMTVTRDISTNVKGKVEELLAKMGLFMTELKKIA